MRWKEPQGPSEVERRTRESYAWGPNSIPFIFASLSYGETEAQVKVVRKVYRWLI